MTETQNTSRRPGALIAMSGGVDSSVAAWLMQQAGEYKKENDMTI